MNNITLESVIKHSKKSQGECEGMGYLKKQEFFSSTVKTAILDA